MVNNGIVVTTMTVTQTDYENPWFYKDTPFTSDDIGDFFGFVYRITNLQSGKQYIGRKYFYQFRKPRGKSRKVRSESVTGKNTMDLVTNLIPIENLLEMNVSKEK